MNSLECLALGCGVAWLCASAPVRAHEVHGYLTLTSDYVFRGASQSNEAPTVQAGLDYLHPAGMFAGVFAARTDFASNPVGSNPGSLELDAYLGFSREAGRDWSWDVVAVRYDFPDSRGFDYAYEELAANLRFRDAVRLGMAVSDDAAASGARGWTAEVELRRPLGDRFQWSGSLGHYEFARSGWRDYSYWDLGVSAVFGPVTFDVRYFDASDETVSPVGPRLTRGRLVGSISIGF